MLLLDLLQAELAAVVHHLLVLADHPSDTHYHCVLSQSLTIFSEIQQEDGFGQVRQRHLLSRTSTQLSPRSELLVQDDAPLEVFQQLPHPSCRVHLTEFPQGDGNLFSLIVLPEDGLAAFTDGDGVGDVAAVGRGGSRLTGQIGIEEGFIAGTVVALSHGEDG